MATTPTYGLRYQGLTDAPDGAALGQNLAEDVEDELERIDASVATLLPITAWADFTPSAFNVGAGTWSTKTGRWRRIGPKTVCFKAYFVVNHVGSGSAQWGFTLPTDPNRDDRWVFSGHSNFPTGTISAVCYDSGSGRNVDEIVLNTASAVKMDGSDLASGMLITISGVYEEA